MQRLACLLILIAACGGGIKTDEASLIGAMPTVKSAAAKPFTDADGSGKMVLGWTIELYEKGPGADCTSDDNNIVASVAIYTNQAPESGPEALITVPADILIVTMSPPTVAGSAAATMSATAVTNIVGLVAITEFHQTDTQHADRIKGTITAGGKNTAMADVDMMGTFTAPVCIE